MCEERRWVYIHTQHSLKVKTTLFEEGFVLHDPDVVDQNRDRTKLVDTLDEVVIEFDGVQMAL
jgi:hypothetical protein